MAERWSGFERENPPVIDSERRAASLEIIEIGYGEN
jgi:hypothetical protein